MEIYCICMWFILVLGSRVGGRTGTVIKESAGCCRFHHIFKWRTWRCSQDIDERMVWECRLARIRFQEIYQQWKWATYLEIGRFTIRWFIHGECNGYFKGWSNYIQAGLYPSTFADPRFRKEDSVFVTHECSPGGLGAKFLKAFAISAF